MTIFWILAAGLAGLAVLIAVAPLLNRGHDADRRTDPSIDPETDQAQLNLALFKQQLTELDADLESGKLDQIVYESARRDLERQLLHDLGDRDPMTAAAAGQPTRISPSRLPSAGRTALALVVAIPLLALALYAFIGSPSLVPKLEQAAMAGTGSGTVEQGPDLNVLVERLEQRLEAQPDDVEGWMMLGRTHFAMGDRPRAEEALARAYALTPEEPMVVLAYAEAIATNNDHQLEGRPAELISEALEIAPENPTARWLSAMVAFQRGQFQSAANTWRKLLELTDPDSDDAEELRNLIEEAERRAGLPPEARSLAQQDSQRLGVDEGPVAPAGGVAPAAEAGAQPDSSPAQPAAAQAAAERPAEAETAPKAPQQPKVAGNGLEVQVSLDPALANRYPPSTTLFVFARAAAGPPMPLAVQRATLADLPIRVQLNDSMAMMPAMQLSNFPQVIVGARVSPSGQAIPRSGDLEGESGPVSSASAAPVEVVIDRVRP